MVFHKQQQQQPVLLILLLLCWTTLYQPVHGDQAGVKRNSYAGWRPDSPPPFLNSTRAGAIFAQNGTQRFPIPNEHAAASADSVVVRREFDELVKRQGITVPPTYQMQLGPAYSMSNCILCRDGGIDEPRSYQDILNYMTVDMFKVYMKGSRELLRDRCVFYTKAIPNREGLSARATEWACRSRTRPHYSIWHLFPNRYDAENPGVNDFYCAYDDGDHWLASLRIATDNFIASGRRGATPTQNYFQAMSQSMAEMCSGRIIIFTWTPTELAEYRPGGRYETITNIFWSHERPVLRNHVLDNNAELFAVDANNPLGGVRRITNVRTWATGPLEPYSDYWRRDEDLADLQDTFDELLGKRQAPLCERTSVQFEVAPHDYFNDGDARAHLQLRPGNLRNATDARNSTVG